MHLAIERPDELERYLIDRAWLPAAARLEQVARAGEGNMNLVLRVRWRTLGGETGTVIIKQARPWVEKFPDIPAPVERIRVETDFLARVSTDPMLATRVPRLIGFDPDHHCACYGDLGEAADYSDHYTEGPLTRHGITSLLGWLSRLHRLPVAPEDTALLRNRAMRELNGAHIFEIPLAADGPDVDAWCPGLQRHARTLRGDSRLRAAARHLSEIYQRDGDCLLHGDFYPGSFLRGDPDPFIIDPEFAFLGPAEFDVGVFLAHLRFTGSEPDTSAYHPAPAFDADLMRQFSGMEVVRRLIGVAQLPITADLRQRSRWLDWAVNEILLR